MPLVEIVIACGKMKNDLQSEIQLQKYIIDGQFK